MIYSSTKPSLEQRANTLYERSLDRAERVSETFEYCLGERGGLGYSIAGWSLMGGLAGLIGGWISKDAYFGLVLGTAGTFAGALFGAFAGTVAEVVEGHDTPHVGALPVTGLEKLARGIVKLPGYTAKGISIGLNNLTVKYQGENK